MHRNVISTKFKTVGCRVLLASKKSCSAAKQASFVAISKELKRTDILKKTN
jgi:hypothetical protein